MVSNSGGERLRVEHLKDRDEVGAALAREAHVRLTCELLQAQVRKGLNLDAALSPARPVQP